MRRTIIMMTVTMALCTASAVAQASPMDLSLRAIVRDAQQGEALASKSLVRENDALFVPCFIKSSDVNATVDAVEAWGGSVGAIAGDVLSARLPLDVVEIIAARAEVTAMEAAGHLSSKMNTARYYSGVQTVQEGGGGLGTAYHGTNVVVGIVDESLDYGHPDFLKSTGKTRVQYVQQTEDGTLLTCTKGQIDAGSCSITDEGQGGVHGTHVTGIAAGGNATYTGVANLADIMFVFVGAGNNGDSGGTFGTNVLEGVDVIFEKADVLDKAAVVNLSLGTSIGAHDGTSLLEQGLTALSSTKGGRIIVNAAGNEDLVPALFSGDQRTYLGGLHHSISVAAGESKAVRVMVLSGASAAALFTGGSLVETWLDAGQKDTCSVAALGYTEGRASQDFTFPGIATTDDAELATGDVPFATDTSDDVTATDGTVIASIGVDAQDSRNDRPHAQVLFKPSGSRGSALNNYWFDVVIRASGGACTGHMWLYYDVTSVHDFLQNVAGAGFDVGAGAEAGYALADGDSFYTATVPSTASGVIAVGSFMPPKPVGAATSSWTGDNGITYDQAVVADGGYGSTTADLSSFSSLGPEADATETTKPDIVAPGEPIIAAKARGSTLSSAITVGENYYKAAGTSMASPHVTGIVALLLERNNTLSVSQVRTALQTGASTDGMTAKTVVAANSYGAGKVNAVNVLASVSADTSAYSGTGDLDGGGSSSCALVDDGRTIDRWLTFAGFSLLIGFAAVLRLRMKIRYTGR